MCIRDSLTAETDQLVVRGVLVAQLHHGDSGADCRRDRCSDTELAAQSRVGDQVERQVQQRPAHPQVILTRSARSAGCSRDSSSSRATAKLPGPRDCWAADSEATVNVAVAAAAATTASGTTAAKAAINAPRAHPPPVMPVSQG